MYANVANKGNIGELTVEECHEVEKVVQLAIVNSRSNATKAPETVTSEEVLEIRDIHGDK